MKTIKEALRYMGITIGKEGITLDISRDDEYHTQRNNVKVPESACNVTACINWAKACNEKVPEVKGIQPEDALMDVLHSEEAYKYMKEVASWAVGKYPPNEVWIMLEWGLNKFLGEKVCKLDWGATINKVIFSLVKRKAVIIGGQFAGLGHFSTACGFVSTQKDILSVVHPNEVDIHKLKKIIVDDPYGNPLTQYKDHRGNNVYLSIRYFLDAVRSYRKDKLIWGYFHRLVDKMIA